MRRKVRAGIVAAGHLARLGKGRVEIESRFVVERHQAVFVGRTELVQGVEHRVAGGIAQAAVAGSATAPEVRGTLTVNQGLVLLNNLEVGGSITTLPINDTSPVWANAGAAPPDPAAPAVVKGQKAAPTTGKGAAPASASKESAAQAAPA